MNSYELIRRADFGNAHFRRNNLCNHCIMEYKKDRIIRSIVREYERVFS